MTRTADAFPSKYRQRVWEAHWHGHETPCWLCQVCDRDMEWEWARGGLAGVGPGRTRGLRPLTTPTPLYPTRSEMQSFGCRLHRFYNGFGVQPLLWGPAARFAC